MHRARKAKHFITTACMDGNLQDMPAHNGFLNSNLESHGRSMAQRVTTPARASSDLNACLGSVDALDLASSTPCTACHGQQGLAFNSTAISRSRLLSPAA